MADIKPELAEKLRLLEQQLLSPHVRRDPRAIALLLTEDFLEIGASGRIFDRDSILRELVSETGDDIIAMSDFSATSLAREDNGSEVVMVNYITTRSDSRGTIVRRARRTSIWLHREEAWRVRFHQGTLLS